jgi:hypothetical protein
VQNQFAGFVVESKESLFLPAFLPLPLGEGRGEGSRAGALWYTLGAMRAWVLILLALLLLPLVPAPVEVCDCPEDDESVSCAPACDDCACCAPAPRLLAARPGIGAPRNSGPSLNEIRLLRLLSPAPRDVFHVPLAA